MQATRVILIRHGQTLWNTQTRIQGHTDIALDDTGRWQAQCVGRALIDEGLHRVYSSDLSRALETARAISEHTGATLEITPTLRERGFGSFEGKTFAEIEQHHPDSAQRWRARDPSFGPPGGEVLQSFYERCVRAASELASQHPGQCIALVSHGGVLDCLYRAATGQSLNAPRTWQIGNASINRLLHHGQGFSLVGWADTSHLQDEPPRDELR